FEVPLRGLLQPSPGTRCSSGEAYLLTLPRALGAVALRKAHRILSRMLFIGPVPGICADFAPNPPSVGVYSQTSPFVPGDVGIGARCRPPKPPTLSQRHSSRAVSAA